MVWFGDLTLYYRDNEKGVEKFESWIETKQFSDLEHINGSNKKRISDDIIRLRALRADIANSCSLIINYDGDCEDDPPCYKLLNRLGSELGVQVLENA